MYGKVQPDSYRMTAERTGRKNMSVNGSLIFTALEANNNRALNYYYRDLAKTIIANLPTETIGTVADEAGNAECRLFCSYAESDLIEVLQSVQKVNYLDPILLNNSDFAAILNSEYSGEALHLFFSKSSLINGLAGCCDPLLNSLKKWQNKRKNDMYADIASSWYLAEKIKAKIILCLDGNLLNKQSLLILDEYYKQGYLQKNVLGFAVFNLLEDELSAWQSLLQERYNLKIILYNTQLCDDNVWSAIFRKLIPFTADYEQDLLQLTRNIYRKLLNAGLLQKKIKVALAYDEAFNAYDDYELQFLKQLGIDWRPFSPLRDRLLPPECTAVWLCSNNLAKFLPQLTYNRDMRKELLQAYQKGMLFVAQDTAHVYLTEGAVTHAAVAGAGASAGDYYPLCKIIPQKAEFLQYYGQNYRYAVINPLNSNCLAPALTPILSLFNQSVLLNPSLGTAVGQITVNPLNRQKQVISGYVNRNIFSTLHRIMLSGDYEWTENFFTALIKRASAKQL